MPASIQLLATELRSSLGIRIIIQPHFNAHHVGQIQIDVVRFGEALQHSDLLGPFISPTVASLCACSGSIARSFDMRRWHATFLLPIGHRQHEENLSSMINATIEAWEEDGECIGRMGLVSLKSLPFHA